MSLLTIPSQNLLKTALSLIGVGMLFQRDYSCVLNYTKINTVTQFTEGSYLLYCMLVDRADTQIHSYMEDKIPPTPPIPVIAPKARIHIQTKTKAEKTAMSTIFLIFKVCGSIRPIPLFKASLPLFLECGAFSETF